MTGLVLFSLSAVSTLGSMMQADTVPQPGTAQGTVVSTLGRPVARAVLELGSGKARAVSDSLGRFRMTDVPGGKQTLSARAIGFAPRTIAIELGTDVGWWGVIELEPDPQPLPEVIAAERAFKPPEYHGTTRFDDFFRRRRLGSGRFLDRAAIKRSNASSLFQLVQGVPGVRVTWNPPGAEQPSYIRMARCPGTPPRMAVYNRWRPHPLGVVGSLDGIRRHFRRWVPGREAKGPGRVCRGLQQYPPERYRDDRDLPGGVRASFRSPGPRHLRRHCDLHEMESGQQATALIRADWQRFAVIGGQSPILYRLGSDQGPGSLESDPNYHGSWLTPART